MISNGLDARILMREKLFNRKKKKKEGERIGNLVPKPPL